MKRRVGVLEAVRLATGTATLADLWDRLANEWKPPLLEHILTHEVSLDGMGPHFERMLSGDSRGRTLVRVKI